MESNVYPHIVCDKCKKRTKRARLCAKCGLHICPKCGSTRCPVCDKGTLTEPPRVLPP